MISFCIFDKRKTLCLSPPRMAEYLLDLRPRMKYVDRKAQLRALTSEEEYRHQHQQRQVDVSTTVYVGNLACNPFPTTEEQLWEHLSWAGRIKRLIMGLNPHTGMPAGFCFAEYFEQESAIAAASWLRLSVADDRVVSVGFDVGRVMENSRYWARGKGGAQVRDVYRQTVDEGRGGLGARRADAEGIEQTRVDPASSSVALYTWLPLPVQATQPGGASSNIGQKRKVR